MKILAFDTSGSHMTVVLTDGEKSFIKFNPNCHLKHSVMLMPLIELVLENNKVDISDIDVFACVVGPGSFTGIRIGVSTAKAFSYATGKDVLPVTSFDVILGDDVRKVLTIINAQHNNFYVCGYSDGKIVLDPCFLTLDDVVKLREEYILVSAEEIVGLNTEIRKPDEGLYKAVLKNLSSCSPDREVLVPLYIRKSQAEENK